ncbi:hypothetical protein MKX03_018835 [Papaver bracteatum]|nr:hypothetical protein MKX03_018835 [Papaver bracteatum]
MNEERSIRMIRPQAAASHAFPVMLFPRALENTHNTGNEETNPWNGTNATKIQCVRLIANISQEQVLRRMLPE